MSNAASARERFREQLHVLAVLGRRGEDAPAEANAWIPMGQRLQAHIDRPRQPLPGLGRVVPDRLPAWVWMTPNARREHAVLTACIACARQLRGSIDGALRIEVARIIGETRLDALIERFGHRKTSSLLPEQALSVERLCALGGLILRTPLGLSSPIGRRTAECFPSWQGEAPASEFRMLRWVIDAQRFATKESEGGSKDRECDI